MLPHKKNHYFRKEFLYDKGVRGGERSERDGHRCEYRHIGEI